MRKVRLQPWRASLIFLVALAVASPNRARAAVDSVVTTGALLPVPYSLSWGEGEFVAPHGMLGVAISGGDQPRLSRALERWRDATSAATGMVFALGNADAAASSLSIQVAQLGGEYPTGSEDESYRLAVSSNGILIQAPTTYGALHALQSLRQLARQCGGQLCFIAADIVDHPRFAVRGLMIDVVRHWMPVETIKRQLDGMEAVKLNYLHLHLSDDQSFRVESLALPRLHEKGSDGDYYRQADIRDIVDYAADRGIRVVPEFDLPGHSRSWQIAYPSLSSRPGKNYRLYKAEGVFSDPIDPTHEETYQLLTALVTEMTSLFPDPWFHIGGDEVNFDAWDDNAGIQAFMDAQGLPDAHALQAWFVNRYAGVVTRAGRTPIAWADVLSGDVSDELIVQHWFATDVPASAAKHRSLVSVNYYLDHMRSAEFLYRNNPLQLTTEGAVNAEANDSVVGVVAAAWAEIMDQRNIDQCLWPRSAAIAERLWSPAGSTDTADIDDVYRRMELSSDYLKAPGFQHGAAQRRELAALAGSGDVAALQTLASLLEPVPFYAFRNWHYVGELLAPWLFASELPDAPFQTAPFTGVLSYESLTAWHFNRDVARYLSNPQDVQLKDSLLQRLREWSQLYRELDDTIPSSSALQEQGIVRLAGIVSRLADIGIRAINANDGGNEQARGELTAQLDYVSDYDSPPFEYSGGYLWASLKKMFQPPEVRQHTIAIQPGIRLLVEAQRQQSGRKK